MPIQITLDPRENLVAGPRPINITDEVWEDIKDMSGVEIYEDEPEPKPRKSTKKVDTEKE